ncbi:methionine--tRNA ligase [Candidatus Kaiserbacteria bacterium]|nr:methionine--tRNA ligase [Candidatus Kaiserbacteria bacterium]
MHARYITTTLPYVNASPHIGFALEIVKADVIARLWDSQGDEVFFNTGTDEHGQKVWQEAVKRGMEPQAYVDEYAAKFKLLKEKLGLYPKLHFIRTTDPHHKKAAQEFWKRCKKNIGPDGPDIYKKNYKIKYCVGCELEKTDSELVNGRCPLHPNAELEIIDEENYFFRFSRYQQPLLDLYTSRPDFVIPDFRQNEVRLFVERGLQDFSISRLKEKMPWGIDVPGDPDHVVYVWFDALVNYISTLGWPEDLKNFEKFWGTHEKPNALQIAGKDNLRQQSAMWQAMLMSAGLPNSKQVVIQGFITTNGGHKMSKSLGNVINPFDIVDKFGVDALRYVLLRHTSAFEDSDLTLETIHDHYTAHLTNGLGNLVARVMKLAEKYIEESPAHFVDKESYIGATGIHTDEYIRKFEFNHALDEIWNRIKELDEMITKREPFKLVKENPEEGKAVILDITANLCGIGFVLEPFMPDTSKKIIDAIRNNKKPNNLFPRLPRSLQNSRNTA